MTASTGNYPTAQIYPHFRSLCFNNFPTEQVPYQQKYSHQQPPLLRVQIINASTQMPITVYITETALRHIGLSITVLKALQETPEKIPRLFQDTSSIRGRLERAVPLVADHINPQHLNNFRQTICLAARLITARIHYKIFHARGVQGTPGMYFCPPWDNPHIFINLPKSEKLGSGKFGCVRKVYLLDQERLVAKKVAKDASSELAVLNLHYEIIALEKLTNKRGIISSICEGEFNGKFAIFLPIYQSNLRDHDKKGLSITSEDLLSIGSQLCEGLFEFSKIGIHGDISFLNILLRKKDSGQLEAVFSDFGTFREYGEEDHGLCRVDAMPPEFFTTEKVSPKQDVWALGQILWQLLLNQNNPKEQLPVWGMNQEERKIWASKLKPGWVLQYPAPRKTRQFLTNLLNDMLDPRPENRPTAQQVHERYSEGFAAYKPPSEMKQ